MSQQFCVCTPFGLACDELVDVGLKTLHHFLRVLSLFIQYFHFPPEIIDLNYIKFTISS